MIKKILSLLGVTLLAAGAVFAWNVARLPTVAAHSAPIEAVAPLAADPAVLAAAVRIPTVSYDDADVIDHGPFDRWMAFVQEAFPRTHQRLKWEIINEYSFLYTWSGQSVDATPILFTAHYDVVPVDDDGEWHHPPFSGQLADGYVWGRGSMDDKAAVISILSATEKLLEEGFVPQRTLVFAFGHDEEIGGRSGAAKLAAQLEARNIRPEWMLDEGMVITDGVISVIDQPIALIGVAEKGYLTLELYVEGEGGHTSSPPHHTAAGVLSAAVARLENSPMSARLDGAAAAMFDRLTPAMPVVPKALFANRWLFEPLLIKQLEGKTSTNAMIRTTAAVTQLKGSNKENVLPRLASATVNFRLLPGDSVDDVIRYVKAAVADPQVKVRVIGEATEASKVSDVSGKGFASIEAAVNSVYPEVLTAPALLIATTDSKHYAPLTSNIYRFRPLWVTPADVPRFHGVNERLAVENYQRMVTFFYQLMRKVE